MRRLSVVVVLLAAAAWAGPKKSPWVEVKTPHFHVFCDGGKNDARNVALQMERMRAVFRQVFPGLSADPPAPIEVLAVRNGKEMRALEPVTYLGKGKLTLGGYFQRTPGHDLVLIRLSAPDDTHPYRIIYHEYTHLITSAGKVPLPVWLSEGLAEFYESTVIQGDDVSLGKPERFNIELLRQQQLIPLATLFAVDQSSPYYHEQDKGTIFYAESWALTHYFMLRQRQRHSQELTDYLDLLRQGQDSVTAAAHAFGDLTALQKRLQGYVNQLSFEYVHEKLKITIDPKTFALTSLPVAGADAVRGEFMAWNRRYADATTLLQSVLRQDPGNARAMASLGFIAYQQHRLPAAAQWYSRAAARAAGDFFDQYFSGLLLARQAPLSPDDIARATANLQAAIRLNPAFAPAYDALAVLFANQHLHLNQADRLELQAISLDPASFRYRFNTAGILVGLNRAQDAIAVLQAALPRAVTGEERLQCRQRIAQIQEYVQREAALQQAQAQEQAYLAEERAPSRQASPPKAEAQEKADLARNESQPGLPPDVGETNAGGAGSPKALPAGPRRSYTGTISAVRCHDTPKESLFSMSLDLAAGGKTTSLHTPDYLRVSFAAANFTPHGVLNPCVELQGMKATVTTVGGQITTIVLSR